MSLPVAADPVADFYSGHAMTMLIPTSPGGDVDARARLLARHMGKFIPGHPTIVPRNMPGDVGLQSKGEEVQKVVEAVMATPKDVVVYAKRILDEGAKLGSAGGK